MNRSATSDAMTWTDFFPDGEIAPQEDPDAVIEIEELAKKMDTMFPV